jgi:uncharacterized membrane protein YfcA
MDPQFLLFGPLAALMVGISKTGIPAFSLLMIPTMALALPGRESVGLLLMLLLVGDMFAIAYYRRFAHVGMLLKLAPWAAAGILLGSLILAKLDNQTIMPVLGFLVLGMLVFDFFQRGNVDTEATAPKWLVAIVGVLAGCGTAVGNAAGPVMMAYLLLMRLPKNQFMGTVAWFFLLVNCTKLPVYIYLDVIKLQTLNLLIWTVPVVVAGALLGRRVFQVISQSLFDRLIKILSVLAAGWLIVG